MEGLLGSLRGFKVRIPAQNPFPGKIAYVPPLHLGQRAFSSERGRGEGVGGIKFGPPLLKQTS